MNTRIFCGIDDTPNRSGAGKTALIAGLLRHTLDRGRTAAYHRVGDGASAEADADFIRATFGISATHGAASASATNDTDTRYVEVSGPVTEAADAAAALQGQVVVVVRYRQRLTAADIIEAVRPLGEALAGVVLNGVPNTTMLLRADTVASLESAGVLLGVIPESRPLMGFTVGELARHLDAGFLCLPEQTEGLIEHLILGANAPDPAVSYFQPRPYSAVICRSDRPDIQLAALDSPVRCLVFCGEGYLQTSVVYRAEDLGVPILKVAGDAIATVEQLSGLVDGLRFRQTAKVPVVRELVEQRLNLARLD